MVSRIFTVGFITETFDSLSASLENFCFLLSHREYNACGTWGRWPWQLLMQKIQIFCCDSSASCEAKPLKQKITVFCCIPSAELWGKTTPFADWSWNGKFLACHRTHKSRSRTSWAARFPMASRGLPPSRQGAPRQGRPHLSRSRLLPAALTQRPGPRSHQLSSQCQVGAACPPPHRGGRCSPRGDGACGALGEGEREGIAVPRPPRWAISAGRPAADGDLPVRPLWRRPSGVRRAAPGRNFSPPWQVGAGPCWGREGLKRMTGSSRLTGPERGARAGRLPSASWPPRGVCRSLEITPA